jgi:hypothetical protein
LQLQQKETMSSFYQKLAPATKRLWSTAAFNTRRQMSLMYRCAW